MLTRFLRWALIIGVFTVPFIPFIVASTWYFPFITGKNFAFRVLVEILAGLTLALALKLPEYRPKFSWMTVAVLALTVASILSTIFSVDPVKSFWSNFERMEGTIGLLHLTLWFFTVSIVLSAEDLWTRFIQVSIVASVGEALYGIFQLMGFATINQGGVRLDGTFGNAIYLAVYMLFHIFLTLLLMVRHKGGRGMQWLYASALILQAVALYYTATRSATLGLIGGLFVAGLYIVWQERKRSFVRKASYFGMGILAAVVLGVFFLRHSTLLPQSETLGRFTSISFSDTTVQARFMIWHMAYQGFKEHPVLGWGQENFSYVFNKYYDPRMYNQEQWFDRAHNAYIDWLIAAGIIGFLAFISLFALAVWSFLRAPTLSPSEKALLVGVLAAYAFHSFFVFDNLMSSVMFFFVLAYAHDLTKKKLPSTLWLSQPAEDSVFYGGTAAAAVAVFCGIYFLNAPGMAVAGDLIAGLTPTKQVVSATGQVSTVQKDPQENLAQLKAVAMEGPMGRQEVTEQLLQTASNILASQNMNPQIKQQFVDLAKERGAAMLGERKGDARLELFYGSFLDQLHDFEGARTHLLAAHQESPAKQSILFELGINNYIQSGDIQNGLMALKQAYDLEPSFSEARLIYAIGLLGIGQGETADKLLVDGFGTVIVDDSRLLNAYSSLKLYDRALAIWQLRAQKDPNNLDTEASLALAYRNAGNASQGLMLLRDIDKKAPQYHQTLVEMAKKEFGAAL